MATKQKDMRTAALKEWLAARGQGAVMRLAVASELTADQMYNHTAGRTPLSLGAARRVAAITGIPVSRLWHKQVHVPAARAS